MQTPARAGTAALLAALATAPTAGAQQDAADDDWVALFNGRNLDGWIPKIRGHDTGENFADTFRVEDGLLTVSYEGYADFAAQYGHLFYERPFSHYRLRIEYRFVGEPAPNVESWALRNSGVMLHSQPPRTMPAGQDFPISIEFQLLGGLGDGNPRPTGNLCSPGTHVVYEGQLDPRHCIDSTSRTIDGAEWVTAEALVLGAERIVHFVDGERVIEYGGVEYGGSVVSGHRAELKPDGAPLGSGHIALQSEGHPVQFRRVELLDLVGCMDRDAPGYRAYFVEHDPERCRE